MGRQTKLERDASTSTLQTSQSEHISPDGKTVTRSSSAVQQQTETNDQGGTTRTARRTSSSSTVSQSQSSSLGQPTAHDLVSSANYRPFLITFFSGNGVPSPVNYYIYLPKLNAIFVLTR